MTEPIIKQQEADPNQALEHVKDLLGYGRLKAARELWVWGTISDSYAYGRRAAV